MSIRKLHKYALPVLYEDDYSIDDNIENNKGLRISDNAINSGNISDIREGEMQIDVTNNRKVIKIKGYLYKETVDADSNVILTKIN